MTAAIRIWADEDGESHLADHDLDFESVNLFPPAEPMLITAARPAATYQFARVPVGWQADWHPSPVRQLVVYLAGSGSVQASDGSTRQLTPGTTLLAEDTTGRGHVTAVTGDEEALVVVVSLPD